MIITLLILIWTGIGIASAIYWWTDNLPVKIEDLIIILLAGSVLGPFMFVVFTLPILIGRKWPNILGSDRILFKARDKRTTQQLRDNRYQNYNDENWPGEDI